MLISGPPKASLCGHFEVVQLLLESGALCERDTFQGERCLYNALNDRIRNLLLSYDYSKSRDPLQPFAGHVTSLLNRQTPQTSDITLITDDQSFHLHKFILSARSPYFARKLSAAPETTCWRIPPSVPNRSLEIAIMGLYFGEVSADFTASDEDQAVLAGIEKLGRQLEITNIFENILESDRRLARQRRTEEVERGRSQLDTWYRRHVLAHAVRVNSEDADHVKWDRQNSIFADVLLCAQEDEGEMNESDEIEPKIQKTDGPPIGIPRGPNSSSSNGDAQSSTPPHPRRTRQAVLYPVHRAMLLRSEYFLAMFSSPFREGRIDQLPHLPIIHVDCTPEVLAVILTYLYTEHANFGLPVAIDVLFAADELFIEKLKVKAAMIISTLGNGQASVVESNNPRGETDVEDAVDIYDVVRAGWDTRVHRLEEFGARYIAYRLERYIDQEEFKELVRESAARIQKRQETDTVELIDDIRYYLSERFRLRFEDLGMDEMTEEETAQTQDAVRYKDLGSVSLDSDHPPSRIQSDTDDAKKEAQFAAAEETTGAVRSEQEAAGAGVVRTLGGDIAGDEFAQATVDYQILLGKIDKLLDELRLDA